MNTKTCCLCNKPMGDDAPFAKIHNVCRFCLESGKDVECLTNNIGMHLTEWERCHIKQCKDCNKYYVPLWYGGFLCGPCTIKRALAKTPKERAKMLAQLKVSQEYSLLFQKLIEPRLLRQKQRIEQFYNLSPEELRNIQEKRIKKYFQGFVPFDIATACRIMVNRAPAISNLAPYELLHDFFIDCYPLTLLSKKYNRSSSGLQQLIKKLCVKILHPYKYRWLFRPVKRQPKEEKQQNIQQRIADIIEAQKRTE